MHLLDAALEEVEGIVLETAAAAAVAMVVGAGRKNCVAMVAIGLDVIAEAGIDGGTGTAAGAGAGRGSDAAKRAGSSSIDDGRDGDGPPVLSSLPQGREDGCRMHSKHQPR